MFCEKFRLELFELARNIGIGDAKELAWFLTDFPSSVIGQFNLTQKFVLTAAEDLRAASPRRTVIRWC